MVQARPRLRSLGRPLGVCSLALGTLALSGCSIVSPWPLWELAKAGGAAASLSVGTTKGTASNTIGHEREPLTLVCIEYNPQVQVNDIVPALQVALRDNKVESRVYESPVGLVQCPVWLRYTAYVDWDIPPFGDNYKAYVSTANLTLQTASGTLLASSQYKIDGPFGRSKWANTRDKLSPVITALLTRSAENPAPDEKKAEPQPTTTPNRLTRGGRTL